MSFRLLLLFVVVPVVELAILIEIGKDLGFWPTIGLILFTGILGSSLTKKQGMAIWQQFNGKMQSGQLPGSELVDGLIVLISGALLLTPGILTDFVGFLGLIPLTRTQIRKFVQKRLLQGQASGKIHFQFGFPGQTVQDPPSQAPESQWQGSVKEKPDYVD